MINNNPQVAHLFEIAERLEGLTRHASKHAAGIVISPEPIDQVLPVYILLEKCASRDARKLSSRQLQCEGFFEDLLTGSLIVLEQQGSWM